MPANLKVRLFKGKTHADGTHPIQLQFYLNGKLKRKNIYNCHEDDWNLKTNRVKPKTRNASYINNLITEKFAEYERDLIKIMNGQGDGSTFFDVKTELTLDAAIGLELDRYMKEKRPAVYNRVKYYRLDLAENLGTKDLLIKNVNLRWFQNFKAHLLNNVVVNGEVVRKANSLSTASYKIKYIRRVVEKYSEEKLSDDIKNFKINSQKPVKQKLTETELSAIENLELPEGSNIAISRDVFLLQVYMRGSRVGAILQAYSEQFKDGRYNAITGTGKTNVGSKIIPKAQVIIDKYINKHDRLFPLFHYKPNPALSEFENLRLSMKHKHSCTTIVNKSLKIIAEKIGLSKPLSSHIARHTFARMAIDKIKNPMVTMELLGHKSLSVHQQYLNDIRKDDVLDAAADDIFS